MSELLKKNRDFVVPGDEIVKSMEFLPGKNCFREGDSILAKKLGIVSVGGRVISVIPLNTTYTPRVGDMVIGKIKDVASAGWQVDIEGPFGAFLPLSGIRDFVDTSRTDLSRIFGLGDSIYAKVSISGNNSLHVSMQDPRTRKLRGGRIVRINPAKVPRLIGKEGSMITMIKNKTNCRISVGQNGFVWLDGEQMDLAIKAINMIEEESFREGLTDRVAELLGATPPPKPEKPAAAGAETKPAPKEAPAEKGDE